MDEFDAHIINWGLATLVLILGALLVKLALKIKELQDRYSAIIDIDQAVARSKKEKDKTEKEISDLRKSYKEKKALYDEMMRQAAVYDEEIQLAELGFYKPHYDFDTSEKYKSRLEKVRDRQKKMLSDKTAIFCTQEWTFDGSAAKGRKWINRAIRLATRAFNGECDSAISNVRWNNAVRMEKRLQKAYETINKLNEPVYIFIAQGYYRLKIEELRLTHEYRNKKQQEKEEQAEIKRLMREEAKVQQEAERAIEEEQKQQKMLERARREAERATGERLEGLQQKIAQLTTDLEQAQDRSKRATSRAQQTKQGHVYVISNIGSFGEDVYKIGMTRRLEPFDRVRELGDASVPFKFDVHAMIFSENAPELESALHHRFDPLRLNLVNKRREFFNASLADIESEAKKIAPDAEFFVTAEAQEYRESQSLRAQAEKALNVPNIPSEI